MFKAIDLLLFVLPILFSVVTLVALHWFPWHCGTRPLGRVASYFLGTAVVVGIPVLTMLLVATLGIHHLEWFWAALLVANTVISGGAISIAHWIDSKRALTLEDGRATRRD